MSIKTTYHRDGTVTYWSVYNQQWVRHASTVPDAELAAMGSDERDKVLRHLAPAILQGRSSRRYIARSDAGEAIIYAPTIALAAQQAELPTPAQIADGGWMKIYDDDRDEEPTLYFGECP